MPLFGALIPLATQDYLIAQSLRFNDDDSAYLYRTPSVTGNRKTFTFSVWVKLGNIGADWYTLFNGYTGSTSDTAWLSIAINVTGALNINGWSTVFRSSNALLRDPNAWYHIVVQCDSTNATANDRIKAWINGTAVSWATNNTVTLNQDFGINSTGLHTLGRRCDSANDYLDGLMALPIFVDGSALDYTSFAKFDGIYYGPKRYSGSYGTNGFQLDFSNTSYYGKDTKATYDAIGVTFRGSNFDATNASSYSETAAAIGTADADRYVFVALMAYTSATDGYATAVAFDGPIAGELVFEQKFYSPTSTARSFVQIWKANVPTGTTTDIDITINTTIDRLHWGWWTAPGDAQILDQQIDLASDVTPDNSLTINLFCPDNGFVLAPHFGQGDAGDPTITFGGTGITEVFETYATDGDSTGSGASGNYSTAGTNTLTCVNGTGNQYYYIFAGLSFVPVNDNSFVSSGLATNDQLQDTPTDSTNNATGSICSWASHCANGSSAYTLTNANMTCQNASSQDDGWWGNIFVNSGKWYFEATLGAVSTGNPSIGVVSQSVATSNDAYDISAGNGFDFGGSSEAYTYHAGGNKINDSAFTSYGSSYTTNDVIGVALDLDNGVIWFSKNGTWLNSATITEIQNGTTTNAAFTGLTSGEYFSPFCHNGSANVIWTLNCGQSGFAYTQPTGFNAIATQNLPAPTINNPSEHFNTVLYTGAGAAQSITGVGFQPDLVWLKSRDSAFTHILVDNVRGDTEYLQSNSTAAAVVDADLVSSLDGDGFSLGWNAAKTAVNTSSANHAAWCWKANGAGSANSDGTISSTVSANTTAGFSIVSYTGTGSAGTVGHGLGVAPSFFVIKNRGTGSKSWICYHKDVGATKGIKLEETSVPSTNSLFFNNTAPSSSVFTVGSHGDTNNNTDNLIAYCWAEVEGFSKFGSYTGNASTNGPFIYTGFKPAFVMVKRTDSTGSWVMVDTQRNPYNTTSSQWLYADTNFAEATATVGDVDFLSNGFKCRDTGGFYNASGGTYIYAAFAEAPFQGGSKPIQQGRAA